MCFPNVALQCVSRLVLFPFSLPCYVIILTLVASCKMSSTMKVRSWETLRNLPMQLQKQLMAVFMGINWGLVYPLWVCGLFSHKNTCWRMSDDFQRCRVSICFFFQIGMMTEVARHRIFPLKLAIQSEIIHGIVWCCLKI
jgi:hypothetical protein